MNILALECSTTSAKAMVYNDKNGILKLLSKEYGKVIGGLTQDAQGVFSMVMEVGREAAEGFEIDAVSLGSTWHNLLVLDKDMNPVTRALTWQYMEASSLAENIRRDETLTKEIYENTGCMPHAIYPAYKLMLLQQQGLDLSDKFISSQGSWHFYRLTGEKKTTASMLAGSGLLNTRTKQYDDDIFDMIGIEKRNISEIIDYKYKGSLTDEGAALLGLKPGIPVIPTHPDGSYNQVGALKHGRMTLSVGTSAALRLSSPEPRAVFGSGLWCYLSPTSWLVGAATSGCCNCVDWAKNSILGGKYSYKELEEIPFDAEKLPVYLPYNFGERCPGWNDAALGTFTELRPDTTGTDLYHSVREGTLMNIRHCYENLIKVAGVPEKIIVSGGILNSPSWLQMLSDILNAKLYPDQGEQASLVGSARIAICSITGANPEDYDSPVGDPVEPKNASFFDGRFEKYMKAYKANN